MATQNEHDDDLEPVVNEGAEIETENWDAEDHEESGPGNEATNPFGGAEQGTPSAGADQEEQESDASDSI
jgi:hypothetical protein